MTTWLSTTADHLWQSGLAAIPLILIAAAAVKLLPCRPSTRHLMWLMVLVWPVLPPLLPGLPNPWAESESAEALAEPSTKPDYHNRNARAIDEEEVPAPAAGAITVPSPRSGAGAASAQPELLAQPRGAVRLPPTGVRRSQSLAVNFGPVCPAPAPVAIEQVCWADREPVESLAKPTPAAESRKTVPTDPFTVPGMVAAEHPHHLESVASDAASQAPVARSAWVSMSEQIGLAVDAGRKFLRGAATGLAEWASVGLKVRDDVALLPPLPTEIWAGGTLLILLLAVVRVAGFRRLIRRAEPPSAKVRGMVEDAARSIGLRRAPEVWMVAGCMSPMVWCAFRPRLLFPLRLWAELDDVGRRAVIMHELAHLRRKDHWVLWAEGLVGSLYWWHPAVWWVRRKLRLEAEYCCDAWVTTLLPRTRRAYAQALLKTRQYVGEGTTFEPAMGMGISSGRAKRFARRLTMVMTTTTKPGASIWGVSLVLLMATSGWLVSPARSCPNKETEAKPCDEAKAEKVKVERVQFEPRDERTTYERHLAERAAREAELARAATPAAQYAPAIEGALAQWALASGPSEKDQKRIEELQQQLESLGRQLEALHEQVHSGKAPRARQDGRSVPRVTPVPPMPPMPSMPGMPAMPRMHAAPPAPPSPRGFGMETPPPGEGPHGMFAPRHRPMEFPKPGQTWADISDEEVEWRSYKLSDGKLEDFTKFMSRSDVPILVRPGDGVIEIRATQRQHEVFHAFFQIIDPSEERAEAGGLFPRAFAVGGGQGVGAAVGCGPCKGEGNCQCPRCNEVRAHRRHAEQIRAEARAMADDVRARSQGEAARVRAEARARAAEIRDRLRQESRRIRVEAENHEELIRSLEEQADTLRDQGERMRDRAERIRERAERVREKKQQADDEGEGDDAGGAFQEHMEVLERSAQLLNEQAELLQAKVAEVLEHMESVRNGSAQLEEHAEEVERRAEAIAELGDSLEGLEAGPELAMSVAELAARMEQLAAPGAAEAAEEFLSAWAAPQWRQIEFAMPDIGALEEAIRGAAEAIEVAVEDAAAAEVDAEEVAEPELDDDEDNDDDEDDGDEDDGHEDDDPSDKD